MIPTGGFRLRSFSLVDVWDAIEIRGTLEGTAVRFAAERLERAEDLARVKRLISKVALDVPITVEGFAQYLEGNKAFHRELWSLSKSPSLIRELVHVCKIPFAAPEALVFGLADREQSTAFVAAEHHRAIVEAIENREGARAESLAREHSKISRRNLELAFRSKKLGNHLPGLALISI